ncbi:MULTISPECIES: hypothetical protein [Nonomuraea]|uniref:Helix-turn-helix domain-containing protein n=1 Tax=Nonomuraea africana TaxID=46171 RepID=A0ABR9KWZ9_9ACTN|nr:hypothetical protein [Nonomuraea africana]MBE1566530.1 hypothetical protein [Nonomuraea africana]
MGRPTKLTPDLADKIVEAFEAGNSVRRTAALVGVNRATLHDWLAQGEADDAPELFSDFSDRCTRARTKVIGELFNAAYQDAVGGVEIKRAVRPDGTEETQVTPPNGKVALELMSRMDPEWRPVKAYEISGPEGRPVELSHQDGVVESVLERVRKAKERRAAEAEQAAAASAGGDGE